jgi:nucleoside diphosphate kinase
MHPKKEKTFVILKPDAIQRGLVGEIIKRIERIGLKIVAMKMMKSANRKTGDFGSFRERRLSICVSQRCRLSMARILMRESIFAESRIGTTNRSN